MHTWAESQARLTRTQGRWSACLLAVALAVATVLAYWPVGNHAFVDYDDGDYVADNAVVQQGLSRAGVQWAFRSMHASNWHPLTWLSHMLDCQLFGLRPGAHHLTNLALHVANTLLLLAALLAMTGRLWPAALIAALFALHPLHVESVAWIAERKDVLSSCFGFAALWAYTRHARRRPGCAGEGHPGAAKVGAAYVVALVCFACSLMSKPMWVTLPAVLILLDYWPLRRLTPVWRNGRLDLPVWATEKLPFLALSVMAGGMTWLAQRHATVMPLESHGLSARFANALVAYAVYLRKLVWPSDLAFFYPMSSHPVWEVIGSGALLAAVSTLVLLRRQHWPYALVGWLWYLGTLVPVIGVVQVGEQAWADRYTYLPAVGLFLWLAYGLDAWLTQRSGLKPAVNILALVAVLACGGLTRLQVGHWRDSRALFEHALAVTQNNWLAHNNLGVILAREGNPRAALAHFQEAVRIKPDYARAHRNLGAALLELGRSEEAVAAYRRALALRPNDTRSLCELGTVLARLGQLDEASELCARAVDTSPRDPLVHYDYGLVLKLQGRLEQAAEQLAASIRLKPDDPQAHFELGDTLARLGDRPGALRHLAQANTLRPDWPEALAAQAWLLATTPEPDTDTTAEALQLARRANELTGHSRPDLLATLAAAQAADGRFAEAAATAQRALGLAERAGLSELAAQIRPRLRLYEAGKARPEQGGGSPP